MVPLVVPEVSVPEVLVSSVPLEVPSLVPEVLSVVPLVPEVLSVPEPEVSVPELEVSAVVVLPLPVSSSPQAVTNIVKQAKAIKQVLSHILRTIMRHLPQQLLGRDPQQGSVFVAQFH